MKLSVFAAIFAAALTCSADSSRGSAPTTPNILILLSDNQGWGDIGYYGSEIRTPHLDQLAAEGVRLDQFYVYPMCSPTRAALISGRAPSRYGILGAIGYRSRQSLPPDIVSIADALKARGYETAITGKWHVGLWPEVGPRQFGFDSSYGFLHGQIDKYTHRYKSGDQTWHRDDKLIDEEGHCLDLIAAEAIKFLEQDRDKPFFLYVPFGAPHPPLQEEDKWVKPYEDSIKVESRRLYAAAVTHMDAAIGDIIASLVRMGQRDNTLVIFASDNGPIEKLAKRPQDYEGRFGPYPVLGDNGPYRGWIGELYEGCVRTPALLNWPGVLEPSVIKSVTSVLDLYPTSLALAGGTVEAAWKLEGRDIWPLLTGTGNVAPITLDWKVARDSAIRHGNWKLIVSASRKTIELYNMANDPYESTNVASDHPDQVTRLKKLLDERATWD